MKRRLKELLLALIARLTGRRPALLPPQAADEGAILRLTAPYRIADPAAGLRVDLLEPTPAGGRAPHLAVELLTYEGHFPRRCWFRAEPVPYPGPCRLHLDLASGRLTLGSPDAGAAADLGRIPLPLPGRRFCLRLTLDGEAGGEGGRRERLTGHYLPAAGDEIGAGYFSGENYVDHEAESAGEAARVLELLERFPPHGSTGGPRSVLEVGCATGNVLAALAGAGYRVTGLDISAWAVERAAEALGPGVAFEGDAEAELPAALVERGPFDVLLLWVVLEHFRQPFATLERLGSLVAPGGLLLLNTTNADSLTRFLFKGDWEGHFDGSHHGVEAVGAGAIERRLPRLGWTIRHLRCHLAWSGNADPTHAALRDWYAADARFRRLLEERKAGDLIELVAERQGPAGGSGER